MKAKIIIAMLMTVLCASACSGESAPVMSSNSDYSSLDAKGSGWGFVRKKGAPPETALSQTSLLERYGGIFIDHNGGKSLYLTFDEGYENGCTASILDTLAKTQTPAAFFVTGPYLEKQTDLVKRMIDEGHIVGNHTVNHLNLPNQPAETVKSEITELNAHCEELYGYTMKYMRPPEGEFSERTLAITHDLGLTTVMWSFAYKDWDINAQQGAQHAYESVVPYLHDGAVLLLHAVSTDNASALENIINTAKENGYTFKSLDEINIDNTN